MSFDIFCSYAHSDNDDGWVVRFADSFSTTFRKLTGEAPKLFLDREALITSDIWEKKIRSALEASQLMLAIISPSYIRSEWCALEWELFEAREKSFRRNRLVSSEQGLICPLLLYSLERGRFNEKQQAFASRIKERQWLDLSSQLEGTPLRPEQIRDITETAIDILAELESNRRKVASIQESMAAPSSIMDPGTKLEWAGTLSPTELTFKQALAYVSAMKRKTGQEWRLPSKKELESLLDQSAMVTDPKASPFPLREPFNAQRSGYLHSGQLVVPSDANGGNYIMNVRNGHIFNGKGHKCFVRAVRNTSNHSLQGTLRDKAAPRP